MGALHVQRDAHFLGAPGGEGGVLAGPDGRDLEPHEPEAGLDVLHALEAPDVDEAAALHLLPHEHEIVPVHAGLEIFRRVDDEDLIKPLPQRPDERVRHLDRRRGLAGDAADDAAVRPCRCPWRHAYS